MGNFSRDTFERLKHYVSVRLQQGVPIVDADWNGLQDIRKHEHETFLRWIVGNGVPLGNDGFAIGAADANDFSIAAGHCLVEGWTVVNESALSYTEQAQLPALTTPETDRTDTVYLDVWEREVGCGEDDQMVNPIIGIETCVRTKREWVVRVAEGATELPAPPPGHVFYPLATLDRKAGEDGIGVVTDLRHTGLTLAGKVDRAGDRITGDLAVDGHVGIGTVSPASDYKLDVNGKIRGGGTVEAWSAERTGHGVAFDGVSNWQVIPGLSISFALTRSALVQLAANGSQLAKDGTIHCGYRYVVDDAPKGHAGHGQRILVTDNLATWWHMWSLIDVERLQAGNHTIAVETRNSSGSGRGIVCGQPENVIFDYTGGILIITAIYQP
ncbi:MAG: hypothetical protein GY842_24610 [bacterium]|nr:hypothetical protein [bacterium]